MFDNLKRLWYNRDVTVIVAFPSGKYKVERGNEWQFKH